MKNTILDTILEIAPKKTDNENEFISHFNQNSNSFVRPSNLPHYLEKLWIQLGQELGKSPFLKTEFFDFKQLKFGGRVIKFRFYLLIFFLVEVAFFIGWAIEAYRNSHVY